VTATIPAGPTVVGLVFAATMREMLRRKTFVFLFLVCSIPMILTMIWRLWGGEEVEASVFFTNLVSALYLQIFVYVVALAFGIPTVHSEVQGRTITYLFTRPVGKVWVYAGKLLAVQLTAGIVLAASLMVCFAVMTAGNFGVITMDFIRAYLNHVFLVLIATVCATGVCAILGTAFSKPIVWGVLYCFGWEAIVSKFPSDLRLYTINFHIRNLLFDNEDVVANVMDFLRNLLTQEAEVSVTVSALALLAFFLGATAFGGWLFGRKEYVIS
jgi:hypothetical protein